MIGEEVINELKEAFLMPFNYLILPQKRVFILYLFTSLLMAFFVYRKTKSKKNFIEFLFNKKVWWSNSSKTDYLVLLTNSFVKIFLIAPFVFLGIYMQNQINYFLIEAFGVFEYSISKTIIIISYTITVWLVGDFASFYLHYLMHKIPFFWQFHKTHHSATVLNPFTQYRIHPVELFLTNMKGLLVYGVVTGLFFYLGNGKVGTITFIGVNVFKFFFLFLGSNLRHSHVKFKFKNSLEYVFISPFQHQIHHSDAEEHFNKNLGSQLAIWDWFFGTLVRSENVNKIQFGLGKKENKDFNSFWKTLFSPFRKALKL